MIFEKQSSRVASNEVLHCNHPRERLSSPSQVELFKSSRVYEGKQKEVLAQKAQIQSEEEKVEQLRARCSAEKQKMEEHRRRQSEISRKIDELVKRHNSQMHAAQQVGFLSFLLSRAAFPLTCLCLRKFDFNTCFAKNL